MPCEKYRACPRDPHVRAVDALNTEMEMLYESAHVTTDLSIIAQIGEKVKKNTYDRDCVNAVLRIFPACEGCPV